LAHKRNLHVADLADVVLIVHAAVASNTEKLFGELSLRSIPTATLDLPANANILNRGAIPLAPETAIETLQRLWTRSS
jgi:hypothetical protein